MDDSAINSRVRPTHIVGKRIRYTDLEAYEGEHLPLLADSCPAQSLFWYTVVMSKQVTCDSFEVPPTKEQIVLCDLRAGNRLMTTWLNKHPKLKEGVSVTLQPLKDTLWKVEKVYISPMPHMASSFDWHRKWDNNI